MLPGCKLPQAWTMPGIEAPFHLRGDAENGYLAYGSEELVGTFPLKQYPRYRDLQAAIYRALIQRQRMVLDDLERALD